MQLADLELKIAKLQREYEVVEERCNDSSVKYEELKKKLSDTGNLASMKQVIQKLNVNFNFKLG